MTVSVISPGLLSSFQDQGRSGYQHLGVPVAGAMDNRAHRLANLLAGNAEDEATLEITLVGPTLRFNKAACIAISGADLSPTINHQPVPNNRPLVLRPNDILAFGARKTGARAYIAWHGGIVLPSVLNSRSTCLRSGFGGFQGRALQKNDTLALACDLDAATPESLAKALWNIKVYLPAILGVMPRDAIRVLPTADSALFTDSAIRHFYDSEYTISPSSNRMGYRLSGQKLALKKPVQLLSAAINFGTIQVPPDGYPITLMADRQTTGGYPKIAHIATVDLPVVAQCMPGETLRFKEIDLNQAQQLDSQREEAFERLFQTLRPLRKLFEPYQRSDHDNT